MKITFLNHACFSIENESSILLNDPYLDGTAFNDGWDLIVKDIKFNFNTSKKFLYIILMNIQIIFQYHFLNQSTKKL